MESSYQVCFDSATNSPSQKICKILPIYKYRPGHFSAPTEGSNVILAVHGTFFFLSRLPRKIFSGLKLNWMILSLALSSILWRGLWRLQGQAAWSGRNEGKSVAKKCANNSTMDLGSSQAHHFLAVHFGQMALPVWASFCITAMQGSRGNILWSIFLPLPMCLALC